MIIQDCKLIVEEYGIPWMFYRGLYAGKIKLLNTFPKSEDFFERDKTIKRIDLLSFRLPDIEKFICNMNEIYKTALVKAADKATQGIILGFSSVELDYGKNPRWNYNPLTGKFIDMNFKWFQIPDFHPIYGDIKVIWEASRFTHFYYFARAYILTKDKKYYRAFSDQLESWLKFNPYGYGPNYKCGQECALRMINALMVFGIFREYHLITKRDEDNIRELVKRCYQKIESNFFYAHKCIKNNHTLSELCGMIVGAWCCGDEKRIKKAYKWLNRAVSEQFFEDGGYRQYSYNYQRLALQLMEFICKIKLETGEDLTEDNKEKIYRSAMMLYQLQNKTGDVPNYGSNDGALIFPVHSCGYRDFRPVVDGITKCVRGEKIYSDGIYEEEALWFLKPDAEIHQVEVKRNSKSYPQAGCYVTRISNAVGMIYQQQFKSRPGQMDQLHFDLWVNDKNVFCDCGTYSYASEEGKNLSLTSAHNTVKVKDKEQMKKKGPFFIYGWPKVWSCVAHKRKQTFRMISCNGYEHTRSLESYSDGFMIVDSVKPKQQFEVIFHTPCKVQVKENELELLDESNVLAKVVIDKNADIITDSGYRSLFYMNKEEISKIKIIPKKGEATTRIRVATRKHD